MINGFMIQGGGMDESMKEKKPVRPSRRGRHGLKKRRLHRGHGPDHGPGFGHGPVFHQRGGQRLFKPHGKTAQGWGYAVFGKVVDGKAVVDAIKGCRHDQGISRERAGDAGEDHQGRGGGQSSRAAPPVFPRPGTSVPGRFFWCARRGAWHGSGAAARGGDALGWQPFSGMMELCVRGCRIKTLVTYFY